MTGFLSTDHGVLEMAEHSEDIFSSTINHSLAAAARWFLVLGAKIMLALPPLPSHPLSSLPIQSPSLRSMNVRNRPLKPS